MYEPYAFHDLTLAFPATRVRYTHQHHILPNMHTMSTLFAALLAGQFAASAYIPLQARHDDDGENDNAANVVTVTHVISLTTYVQPAESTVHLTSTRTRTSYFTVQPQSDVNPLNGLPVPSKPTPKTATSASFDPPQAISWFGPGPEPPNPTAKPSAFVTKPFPASLSSDTTKPSETQEVSSSKSSTPAFEYPYPTKQPRTSSSSKPAPSSTSDAWEYPYPTTKPKASSADEPSSSSSSEKWEYPYPTKA